MVENKLKITAAELQARKGGTPIVALTAYTAAEAKLLHPHCDFLLVGDSLAMVVYGLETTRGLSVETMCAHGQAVKRGAKEAFIAVDLPQGSYESGPEQAIYTANKVIEETEAQAVKLEGGIEMAGTIAEIVKAGIPVLGHIGLLPQKAENRSAFKIQGRDHKTAQKLVADGKSIADSGAFAMVIEGTVEPIAREITEKVSIPTIGIGASPSCDGQILVTHDMCGLFNDFTPKFVKKYANIGKEIETAAANYADEVRNRKFPSPEHCFEFKSKKFSGM